MASVILKIDKDKKDKFKEIGKEFIVDNVDTHLISIENHLKNNEIDTAIEEFNILIQKIQSVFKAINAVDQAQ